MTDEHVIAPKASDIRSVAVVGCGTIGASWAALFLARGLSVTATDVDSAAEGRLYKFVEAAWPALTILGLSSDASLDRLQFNPDLARACAESDFVQENGPEREPAKITLLKEIDAVVRPDVIVASSSSALQISRLQAQCKHPERIVLGHPFNPPHLVPLVEVAGGAQTTEDAIERAMDFYRLIGKTPIRLKKEIEGHIANRLQAAVFREAVHLLDQGVASLHDIDLALTEGPGLRWALMGPFLTYHLAGGRGGMRAFFDQFTPMQQSLWGNLGTPVLDERLRGEVIQAADEEISKLDQAALVDWRDSSIVSLVKVRESFPKPE
jgi:3-hydroxyacyl-CoA dehydrogenase